MSRYRPPYSKLNLRAPSLDYAARLLRATAVQLPEKSTGASAPHRRLEVTIWLPAMRLTCPATAPAARRLADKCQRTAELSRRRRAAAQGHIGATT